MKGYVVENGYMGYLDGKYVLFADESDYEKKLERSFCYWRSRWTDLHFF